MNWIISIHDEKGKQDGWLGDRFSIQLPLVGFEKVKVLNTSSQMLGTVRRLRETHQNRIFRVHEAQVILGNSTNY